MHETAEKRIRLLGFDVPNDTRAEKLPLPVNEVWPEGCEILWTSWHVPLNCLVAAIYHPSFPAVPPFNVMDITALPMTEGGS